MRYLYLEYKSSLFILLVHLIPQKREEGVALPRSLGFILSWPPSLSLGRFLDGGFLGGPGRSAGGLVGLRHQEKIHHEAGILSPGEP